MSNEPRVLIYDTTLRDGTQGEAISFSAASKLRLTEKLDQFGIDYIEGGFPGANPRDIEYFDKVQHLDLKHARVAAFGSTRRADLAVDEDPQMRLLLESETPVVTIFGKSWLLHVTEVLGTTPEENLKMIEESVRYLKDAGREVIYDAEHFYDGYSNDPEYALETLRRALHGGAEYIVLCDTNGGNLVSKFSAITAQVIAALPNEQIGVHCHDDSGVGVAVSLAGVEAGATMIQGTMNGYGERNGNADLTTIIPNLALKMGYLLTCGSSLKNLRDLSLFVDDMANARSNTRSPYVGASSFAHKGGMHANAAQKVASSYEHIDPSLVGNRQRVLISDMSGRSSIMMKAHELGVRLGKKSDLLQEFRDELKRLEHRGYEYEAADASFKLLLDKWLEKKPDFFELVGYRVIVERDELLDKLVSEASVKLRVNGEIRHTVAESQGPVGALDHALRKALEKDYPEINEVTLSDFKVRILDGGKGADARILVHVESTDGEEIWGTVGASDNIIEASWEALKDSVEYRLSRPS